MKSLFFIIITLLIGYSAFNQSKGGFSLGYQFTQPQNGMKQNIKNIHGFNIGIERNIKSHLYDIK